MEISNGQAAFELSALRLNLLKGIDFFQYFNRDLFTEGFIMKYIQEHALEGFTWRVTDASRPNEYRFVVNYYKPKNIEVPQEIKNRCENTKQLDFFERLFYLHNNSDIFRIDGDYFRYVFSNSILNWKTVLGNAMKNSGYFCSVKTWNKGENASIQLIEHTRDIVVSTAQKKAKTKIAESYVVYLISNGTHYKIGKTKNIESRLKSLQTSSPSKLELISVFETGSKNRMDILERELHEHFSDNRLSGEWFDIKITKEQFLTKCEELLGSIYDR